MDKIPPYLKAKELLFLRFDEPDSLLAHLDLGELQHIQPIGEQINKDELVTTSQGRFVIQRYPKSERDPGGFAARILREIMYTTYLADNGFNTPTFINRSPILLAGALVMVYPYIPGSALKTTSANDLRSVIELVSQSHDLGLQYGTHGLAPELRTNYAPEIGANRSLLGGLLDIAEWNTALTEAEEHELGLYGKVRTALIHSECTSQNCIRSTEGNVFLLNFRQLKYAPLIHDLVRMIEGWCAQPDGTLDWKHTKLLLQSYNRFMPLTDEEKQNLAHEWLYSLLAKIGYSLVAVLEGGALGEKYRKEVVPRRVAQWKAFPDFQAQLAAITDSLA